MEQFGPGISKIINQYVTFPVPFHTEFRKRTRFLDPNHDRRFQPNAIKGGKIVHYKNRWSSV